VDRWRPARGAGSYRHLHRASVPRQCVSNDPARIARRGSRSGSIPSRHRLTPGRHRTSGVIGAGRRGACSRQDVIERSWEMSILCSTMRCRRIHTRLAHPPYWVHAAVRIRLELMIAEEKLWTELQTLVDSLSENLVREPGYFEEGWSAKDLVAHVGGWLAEAGAALERIRFGNVPARGDRHRGDQREGLRRDAGHPVRGCAGAGDRRAQPDASSLAFASREFGRGRPVDTQGWSRALRGASSALARVGGGGRLFLSAVPGAPSHFGGRRSTKGLSACRRASTRWALTCCG
jgi:hypothetical protein